MVVHEIVRDKLYDENGAFLTKKEITKVVHSEESPLPSHTAKNEDRAVTWLKTQSGKVVTKKLINEFINYMSNENI